MARKKAQESTETAKKTTREQETRTDEVGFKAGIPVKLNRRMKNKGGGLLKTHLTAYIDRTLRLELRNQEPLIDKLRKWNKQYKSIAPPKSFPYEGASNVFIPRTKIDVDTVVVRLFDVIWGQTKLAIVQALDATFVQFAQNLEDAVEWWQELVKLKERLFSPILQAVKSGTGIVNINWEVLKKVIYQYATPDEVKNKDIKTYKVEGGADIRKKVRTKFEGPVVRGVSREDFIISSYSDDIDEAPMVGFRTYLRRAEIESRVKQEIYYKHVLDALTIRDDIDETKKERAESEYKVAEELAQDRFEVWRLHLKYDVDDDGEEDDIEVTWHPNTQTIMRAIYNPIFYGFRPFEKLVTLPSEYCFEGTGLAEQLDQLQEALNTIFNLRFDRLAIINSPPTLISESSDLADQDFSLHPGCVKVTSDTDLNNSVRILELGREFPETANMENSINVYMNQTTGIGPANLGQPTAERPVARETWMLIQETNKKIKFVIDNVRDWMSRILVKAISMMAQYKPSYSYWVESLGIYEQKTLDFPLDYLWDNIKVRLRASSEIMNQEVRREIGLTIWQLMSEYMTRVAGMAQVLASPGVPIEFKKVLLEANRIGVYLMQYIIREFNIVEGEQIVLDLQKAMDINKVMMLPEQMPPQGQPPQGQPPQGQPPQGGQPGGGAPMTPPMM